MIAAGVWGEGGSEQGLQYSYALNTEQRADRVDGCLWRG